MTEKFFLNPGGKANITCPVCKKTRRMDFAKFAKKNKEIKFKCKCSCKNVFKVILERRNHIRKEVNLSGELIARNKRYPVTISNFSRMGLKIKAQQELDLNIEEEVTVNFILDDTSRSRVSKKVIIRKIYGMDIGVEFSSADHYDKLGPYILFNSM